MSIYRTLIAVLDDIASLEVIGRKASHRLSDSWRAFS